MRTLQIEDGDLDTISLVETPGGCIIECQDSADDQRASALLSLPQLETLHKFLGDVIARLSVAEIRTYIQKRQVEEQLQEKCLYCSGACNGMCEEEA